MTEPNTQNNRPGRHKISGFYFFGAILLIMIFVSYYQSEPKVPTIECTASVLKKNPDVIMLGTSWCYFCKQARKYFNAHKVNYCEYDIETTAEGARLYKQAGGGGIPILLIHGKKYVGFDPVAFKQLMSKERKT